MSRLPKSVSERLKASVSPVGHPDPDVLTAFSERLLPPHERAVVMEHLARCGECRDIVALALPATESVPELASAAHHGWLRWPVLRWGAVAAGILVIASIGIQHYRERPQTTARLMDRHQTAQTSPAQDQVAQNEAPRAETRTLPAESHPAPQRSQASAAGPVPAASTEAKSSPRDLAAFERPYGVAPSKSAGAAAGVIGGPVGGGRYDFSTGQGNKLAKNMPPSDLFTAGSKSAPAKQATQFPPSIAAPRQTVPSMSEVVEVQSAAAAPAQQDQLHGQLQDQRQVQSQNQQLDIYQAQPQQVNPEQLYAENDKELSKAKPATPSADVNLPPASGVAQSPQTVLTARASLPVPALNWTITSTGGLQRSFDGGRTWQDVYVSASSAASYGYMSEEVAVQAKANREKKKDAKAAPLSSQVPVFRAVAANGFDVWAGGSAGSLYHSVDAGDHWIRVFPLAGSTLLTADITSIRFSDPQHGTIITATSEVWTTPDAGRSWQKH